MARGKKPTVKEPTLAGASTEPASVGTSPVAPVPARTLIGPQTAKPPGKPARERPEPPPIPKPGARAKPSALDPAAARAALDAVLAAPDDDAPRAAYAALLTAAGDPRGEFITVGLELARLGMRSEREDPATKPLWDRFRAVHGKGAAKWTKALKTLGKPTRWSWHRGFLRELRVNGWDAGCTPGHLAAVLADEPITELAIEGGDEDLLARTLALPGIERIRRLAISGWDAAHGGVYLGRVIARAKRLTAVGELRVGVKLGDRGVLALIEAAALDNVVHLALGAPEVSTATFVALAASPLGQRLEILEWLREPVTQDLGKIVVTMPCLHTFVGSAGHLDACHDALAARFRDRLVVENGSGMHYLLDGIKGVTHRPVPKR